MFGTFEFILEHSMFHIGTNPFFYGTKRTKIWNICVYIGTFALYSGKSDVQQWNKTNKLCDKNIFFGNRIIYLNIYPHRNYVAHFFCYSPYCSRCNLLKVNLLNGKEKQKNPTQLSKMVCSAVLTSNVLE